MQAAQPVVNPVDILRAESLSLHLSTFSRRLTIEPNTRGRHSRKDDLPAEDAVFGSKWLFLQRPLVIITKNVRIGSNWFG